MMVAAGAVDVSVAAIGAAALVLVAWLGVIGQRRTRREIEHRVGTPNGQGNVIEMIERALVALGGVKHDVKQVRADVDKVAQEQAQHRLDDDKAFTEIREQIGELK